jgi:predicted Abi (CAAX) family protease
LLKVRLRSLAVGLTLRPTRGALFQCVSLFVGFGVVAAGVGFFTGFLKWEVMSGSAAQFAVLPVLILIRPALVEEIFFRGLLLPHPREETSTAKRVWACGGSLAVFVLMHPLNGMLVRHEAYAVFVNPVFLFLAFLLGLTCTIAYQLSGSLWPSILMHWATVVTWTMLLGGKRVLTGA